VPTQALSEGGHGEDLIEICHAFEPDVRALRPFSPDAEGCPEGGQMPLEASEPMRSQTPRGSLLATSHTSPPASSESLTGQGWHSHGRSSTRPQLGRRPERRPSPYLADMLDGHPSVTPGRRSSMAANSHRLPCAAFPAQSGADGSRSQGCTGAAPFVLGLDSIPAPFRDRDAPRQASAATC
jgi:hypothetical protein